MRVVLANQPWPAFGGSETYNLTVAQTLNRLGHQADLYAPAGGEVSERARERGIRVITGPDGLPPDPHAVITGDAASCADMAGRYPDAVRLYVAHVVAWDPQIPPQIEGGYHAIVAMNDGTERFARSLATSAEVIRLRQPVDLERFRERGDPAAHLRRVLLLGRPWNPASPAYRIAAAACERLGLELRHFGSEGRTTAKPEIEISDADAVLGTGRCVLEAMASQRAAYVAGPAGAGWVMPEGYEAIEADGFTRVATRTEFELDRLCADLRAYDAGMGRVNRRLATANHSPRHHVGALIDLIGSLEPRPVSDPTSMEAIARLVGVQRELTNRLSAAEGYGIALRRENRRLTEETVRLAVENEGQRRHLDAVLGGRRYRFAQWLARPLDAIRARLSAEREPRDRDQSENDDQRP